MGERRGSNRKGRIAQRKTRKRKKGIVFLQIGKKTVYSIS